MLKADSISLNLPMFLLKQHTDAQRKTTARAAVTGGCFDFTSKKEKRGSEESMAALKKMNF